MDALLLILVIAASVVAGIVAENLDDTWGPAVLVLVAYFACVAAIGVTLVRRGVVVVDLHREAEDDGDDAYDDDENDDGDRDGRLNGSNAGHT
jgi:hypothetical protein